MFRTSLTLAMTCLICSFCFSQTPSLVDYDAYEKIVSEVKEHRSERLISADKFVEMSKMDNVVILDTRSKEMYDAKHIKGAIHLNFSDFTQDNLEALFPSRDVNILILKTTRSISLQRDMLSLIWAFHLMQETLCPGSRWRSIYLPILIFMAMDTKTCMSSLS